MGCDIHLSTLYRNKKTNTYHPVSMINNRLVDGELRYFTCDYPYFRNYEVFGTLTDGQVRSDPYRNENNGRHYSLPCRGMFDIERVTGITRNEINDLLKDIREHDIDFWVAGTTDLNASHGLDPTLIEYFADPQLTDTHSHTYFTVAELDTLIRKLNKYCKKISKRVTSDNDDPYESYDAFIVNEIRSVVSLLKQIKQYGMMFGRIGSGDDWIEPEDVIILCCFDN